MWDRYFWNLETMKRITVMVWCLFVKVRSNLTGGFQSKTCYKMQQVFTKATCTHLLAVPINLAYNIILPIRHFWMERGKKWYFQGFDDLWIRHFGGYAINLSYVFRLYVKQYMFWHCWGNDSHFRVTKHQYVMQVRRKTKFETANNEIKNQKARRI